MQVLMNIHLSLLNSLKFQSIQMKIKSLLFLKTVVFSMLTRHSKLVLSGAGAVYGVGYAGHFPPVAGIPNDPGKCHPGGILPGREERAGDRSPGGTEPGRGGC